MSSEPNHHSGAPQRIRILVVDDSAEFRNAIAEWLTQLPNVELIGCEEDGLYALPMVAREHPDLVLMDLQMPLLNGLEATHNIHTEFPEVHVIMTSLHDSERWRTPSLAVGADRFISKFHLRRELPAALAQLFPGRSGGAEEDRP